MHKFVFLYFLFFVLLFSYANIRVGAIEKKYTVYIDPGHGGMDGGCTFLDLKEKDINLNVGLMLRDVLKEKGYEVKMTRSADVHLCLDKYSKKEDLKTRVEMINKSDADLFISIHTNSFTNPKYAGAQVFYNNFLDNNTFIATRIQKYLSDYTDTNRVAKGLKNVMILREINKPGCLIECGFISNLKEHELLKDKRHLAKIVNSIVYGIDDYFLSFV